MKYNSLIYLFLTIMYFSANAQPNVSRSTSNYIILNNKAKFNEQSTSLNLINKIDSISQALPSVDNQNFKVYVSFNYPIMGAVDPEFGLSQSTDITLNQLDQESYYLGLIKSFKKLGNESNHQQWEVDYYVKINLPITNSEYENIQPLEISALENYVSNAINSYINKNPNQNIKTVMDVAEIEGLKIFYFYLKKLMNNESIPNFLENAGFFVHELNHNRTMTRISDSLIITNDNKFTVYNYGGYNIVQGDDFLNYLTNFDIKNDKSHFTYAFFISARNDFQNFENINTQFENSTAKFRIWIHIDYMVENSPNAKGDQIGSRSTFTDKIYVKMENSLTDAETDEILDSMYEESMQKWTEKKAESSTHGCEDFSWQYGWNCVYPWAKSPSDLIYNSNLALGCGFLDGLLGSLEGFYNFSRSAIGVWDQATSFIYQIVENGVDFAAMQRKFAETINQGYVKLKQFCSDAYELCEGIYTFFSNNNYSDILNMVNCMIDNILLALEASSAEAIATFLAYNIGLIAMEGVMSTMVPVGALVGGANIFKSLVGIIKLGDPSNISDFLVKNFTKGTTFVKCKILRLGCFVKDTPVLMASNPFRTNAAAYALAAMPIAVPIQDVQLLDYAVAHKSVNSTYGLTASTNEPDSYQGLLGLMDKDPYTSDQQRERDEYEINDTDWYEVAFEELNGSSSCKLALHNDWITNHSYVADGIVIMNLPEQGISGPFKITSIKHIIPQKKPVDEDLNDEWGYRPVTGLFTHHSDAVLNITFSNSETLGVTAPHPIFSTTHNDWRLAGELEVGEKVLAYHGEATVTKTEKKAESEKVYNLEIKDLHNFLVGDVGVVVHNACARSILGDAEFKARKDYYKSLGHSAAEADELVELEALKSGLIDEALASGQYVEKGLAKTIRDAAKDFADDMQDELRSQIGNTAANVAREVTLAIVLNDGSTFTVYADQLANDAGDLHVGEAKYSTKDKDWDKDWKGAATENQKKFIAALNAGSISNITPRGPQTKLTLLGLVHGQSFNPSKIKSYRLFGSNAGTKTVKKLLKLF